MAILAYILLGLVVGLLGRITLPAPRQVGFWGTLLLGMVGAIVGALLSSVFDPFWTLDEPRLLGLVLSAVGAVVVMVAVMVATRRRVHA